MLSRVNILIVIVIFGLYNTHTAAEMADSVNTGAAETLNTARLPSVISPRQFCRSRGGIVNETEQANIYLCCYVNKNICIVTDTGRTVSWPIPYSERDRVTY